MHVVSAFLYPLLYDEDLSSTVLTKKEKKMTEPFGTIFRIIKKNQHLNLSNFSFSFFPNEKIFQIVWLLQSDLLKHYQITNR